MSDPLAAAMDAITIDDKPAQRGQTARPQAANAAAATSSSSSGYALDVAPLVETDPQANPDAPPACDGGFRPLSSIDVLPIDRLLPTITLQVQSQPLTIVQAATGSGKSSRIPATLLREWYAPARVKAREEARRAYAATLKSSGLDAASESSYPPSLRKHPLILVTQPRRIAAISLAKRVASELGQEVGQDVGFKIGHESMADARTRLLFVTSGWCLQKLVHNPGYLAECSHLVLDEIHERGLDSDILYVILKRIIRALVNFDRTSKRDSAFPSYPSLVLMSATFSTDLFGAYFGSLYKDIPAFRHYADPSKLNAIQIDTRRYPVAVWHLEEIMSCPMLKNNAHMINRMLPDNPSSVVQQLAGKMSKPPAPGQMVTLGPISNSLLHLISWLCAALALCHRSDRSEGNCILVFLPGLQEIEGAAQMIDESLLRKTYPKTFRTVGVDAGGFPIEEEVFEGEEDAEDDEQQGGQWRRGGAPILPKGASTREASMSELVELMILHSVVEDQLKVFEPVRPGLTRIILATNIAESSVTIPFVKYVLDTGSHKEIAYNPKFQCEMLVKKWVSQASAKQRAGRCGRLSPGTVLRLYPSSVYNNPAIMPAYDLPELLRVSLASTILRLKMTQTSSSEEGSKDDAAESTGKSKKSAGSIARFDPSVCNLNDPHSVLSECMQPPDLSSIDQAYEELIKNGAVELAGENAGMGVTGKEVSRFQTAVPGASDSSSSKKARSLDSGGLSADEKRAVYQASVMTPLGRFFAALPFSFHLSRLVALGVVFGPRYLVHAVVISAALSTQDVFLMPMQARGASGGGGGQQGGGGGGGGRRDDRDDPFPQFVAKTTRTRMWCDAGIGSDAIAIVRLIDAYLKYRQSLHDNPYASSGSGGIQRKSHALDQWCADRGVHMKRIKSLTSSISEICYRLSGLVHQDEEREALLQLAAMCGKSKGRAPPPPSRNNAGPSSNSRFPQSAASASSSRGPPGFNSSSASASGPVRGKKHYTYSNTTSAAVDRDSDTGNSAHDDLFHLLASARGQSADAAKYDFRSDMLSTNAIPEDLLSLDPECVAVLQFMLTSALLPNLLQGSAAPAALAEGLPYGRGADGQPQRLNPANTFLISKVPLALLQGREEKLQHRREFEEVNRSFAHVLISSSEDGGGKKNRGGNEEPMGSMALEIQEADDSDISRMRVCLDGRPSSYLQGSDKAATPVLGLPSLEMLILHRMFNNGRLNIMDRGSASQGARPNEFASQAYMSQQQSAGPQLFTLADPKLPGKAIKWRLFSPRSPARIDNLSPISALTAYCVPARAIKGLGGFSDFDSKNTALDPPSLHTPAPAPAPVAKASQDARSGGGNEKGGKGKKGKKGSKGEQVKKLSKAEERAAQTAAGVALAAGQKAFQTPDKSEYTIFAVAASMTVSSGASSEIRAEKVTLLPVGANSGLTSVILSLLLPGDLQLGTAGIIGIKFEGTTMVHFNSALDRGLLAPLLSMRSLVKNLLHSEFVNLAGVESQTLTPLFLSLIRPLIKSGIKSYPSTDPVGYVRKKLNLLPPSSSSIREEPSSVPRLMVPSSVRSAAASSAAASAVSEAADRFEQQRQEILERRAKRDAAVASGAAAARPASASVAPSSAASAAAEAKLRFEEQRQAVLERKNKRDAAAAGRPASAAPASSSASQPPPSSAPAPSNAAAASAPVPAPAEPPMRVRRQKEKPVKVVDQQAAAALAVALATARPAAKADAPATASSNGSATARPAPAAAATASSVPAAAPAAAASSSSSSAPATSSSSVSPADSSRLLFALRTVFAASPTPRLDLNSLCVQFDRVHGQHWKAMAGERGPTLKSFLLQHSHLFTVEGKGPMVTCKEHPGAQQQQAAADAPATAAPSKPQPPQQQPKQQPAAKPAQAAPSAVAPAAAASSPSVAAPAVASAAPAAAQPQSGRGGGKPQQKQKQQPQQQKGGKKAPQAQDAAPAATSAASSSSTPQAASSSAPPSASAPASSPPPSSRIQQRSASKAAPNADSKQ